MKGLERLTIIRNISLKKGTEWVHKDIFRLLKKEDLWFTAYKNLYSKNIRRNEKKTDDCLNILEEQTLTKLISAVVNEHYTPALIKKKDFARRETKLINNKSFICFDKIVIEVIKMILESIFEPIFSESSFGLIENKNEHSALEYIEKEFPNCSVVIQGNIGKCVETIDNNILCNFLSNKISDTRFINLIRKVLNTEENVERPLKHALFNIYIHQFDEWVKKFKPQNSNIIYKTNLGNNNVWLERINQNLITKSKTTIRYARYIEDWIVGIENDTNLAVHFKKETENFLLNKLKLPTVKTQIGAFSNGNISFLNYHIYLPRVKPRSDFIKKDCIEKNRLRFEAPIKKILEDMENNGIIKSISKGYRAISKSNLSTFEDYAIVFYFNSIWIALCKYYSGTTNPHKLQYIHNLLQMSCAMTLAHKHRSSCSKIFKKQGKSLTVSTPNTKRKISFASKAKLNFTNRKWQTSNCILNPFKIMQNQVKKPKIDW